MMIERLTEATEGALADINALLKKLKSRNEQESLEGLRATVGDSHAVVMVMKDEGRIIGMAFLFILQTLQGRNGSIEDVVVDEAYRGQGLGVKIMEAVIEEAKREKVTEIMLTSKPKRVAANKLYQKLGFVQKETNVYEMEL